MSSQSMDGYVCERCGKKSLEEHDFIRCIVCRRWVCVSNIDCTYEISIEVKHNIPNGIPFLHTKTEYRICQDCMDLEKSIPKELYLLLQSQSNGRMYRKGSRNEKDWVLII